MQTTPERNGQQAEALDRLTRLQALTASLSEAVTSEQVADAILSQASAVLGAGAGVVYRLSDDGTELVLVRSRGYDGEATATWGRFPANARTPISDAVRDRQPVLLPSLAERDARYPEMAHIPGVQIEGAVIAVPLLAGAGAIGGLGLRFPTARSFTEQDRAFLLTLAGLCAQALDRARLYDTERAARERAERTEAALRASEQRHRLLSELTSDFTYGLHFLEDGSAQMEWVSESFTKFSGYTLEELNAQGGWPTLVHPDDLPLASGAVERVRAGRRDEAELRLVAKSGEVRWVRYLNQPVRDELGRVSGFVGAARDIHERKLTELALRDSEARLRSVVESDMIGVGFWDAEGRITDPNDALLRMTGYSRDEFASGRVRYQDLTPEEYRPLDEKALAQTTATGSCDPYEKEYVRKDGSHVPVLIGGGCLAGCRDRGPFFALDISALKRAERDARRSEQFYRLLAEAVPGMAWSASTVDGLDYVSRQWEEYTGLTLERIREAGWETPHHPDEVAGIVEKFAEAAGTMQPFEMEFRYRRRDGQYRWFLGRQVPVPDPDGRGLRWVGALIDLDDRRRAEATLRESEGRLRTLSNNLPHGAIYQVVADSHGGRRFLYISAGVERLFGVSPAEAMADATALYGLIHEEDRRRVAAAEEEALGHLGLFDCEFRSQPRGGDIRWLHCRSAPRRLPSGDVVWEGVMLDVTDRRNAEAELARLHAESERTRRLYETALSNSPDINFSFDLEGRFTYANESLLDLWGKSRAEAFGKTPLQLGYPPDLADRLLRQVRQAIDARQQVKDETPFASRFGPREYEYILVPVIGSGGTVEAVVGSAHDITERKQAEAELRSSAERLVAALDASDTGTFRWNPATGEFLEFDDRLKRLFGFRPDEPVRVTQDFLARVHPDDVPRLVPAINACQEGADFEMEYRVVLPGGEVRWLYDRARVVRAGTGEPSYLVGACTDITRRKQIEQESRLSRNRLDLVVNSVDVGLWYCDLPFDKLVWNAKVKEHFGLPPDADVTIDTFYVRLHPDDRERTREAIERSIRDRTGYDIEYRTVGLDGRERWVRAIGRTFYGPTGQPVRFDGITVDVTERVRQEQALQEADRRKDEFLATLAHELRNPLAPLRNGLQVMKLAAGNAEAVEQARSMMERQLSQMVRLVDDLLDVSRITRGKLQLRRERVDLASVVQSAVEGSRPLIEASRHDLTIRLPAEPVHLEADPTRLAQVLSNLLTNAAKYTDRGGRITLTAERRKGDVVVAVRDTGIGIAPDHLPKLFEMFSQVDSALERSQGGLGIGLSLVKGLVKMHGGTVEARSEGLGKGSEFVVRLPILSESPDPRTPQPGGGTEATSRTRRRILVADDNRDAADSLAMMLRLAGHEVYAVHDGQEAVEAVAWFRPELALLDIGMPRLNGFDAARRIREQPEGERIVLVAITGWGQEEDKRRASEAGFDLHLTKPVDPAALEKLLARLKTA